MPSYEHCRMPLWPNLSLWRIVPGLILLDVRRVEWTVILDMVVMIAWKGLVQRKQVGAKRLKLCLE